MSTTITTSAMHAINDMLSQSIEENVCCGVMSTYVLSEDIHAMENGDNVPMALIGNCVVTVPATNDTIDTFACSPRTSMDILSSVVISSFLNRQGFANVSIINNVTLGAVMGEEYCGNANVLLVGIAIRHSANDDRCTGQVRRLGGAEDMHGNLRFCVINADQVVNQDNHECIRASSHRAIRISDDSIDTSDYDNTVSLLTSEQAAELRRLLASA